MKKRNSWKFYPGNVTSESIPEWLWLFKDIKEQWNEEFKIETVYTLGIIILTTSKEGVIFSYLTIQNTILSLQSVSFTKYFSLYYTFYTKLYVFQYNT